MDLQTLIVDVQNSIGNLIQRPKMNEKFLSKPPFRFLHDTITAVTEATGFARGLFRDEELDSANITEKNQKIEYLDKIVNMIGICHVVKCQINSD